MNAITTEISPQLQLSMQKLVDEGWFKNINELMEEAIRRYLEFHSMDLMEQFIQEDIAWGLHGKD